MEESVGELQTRRRVVGLGYLTGEKREKAIMSLKKGLHAAKTLREIEHEPRKLTLIDQIIMGIQGALIDLLEMPVEAQKERTEKEKTNNR